MSQTDTDAPEAANVGDSIVPPQATIPFPRTGDTVHVDVECTLGEYYVMIWSDREGDNEPGELTADNADEFARSIAERSIAVRKLNGCR